MEKAQKSELRIKFYSNGKHLSSYDESHYYDITDADSLEKASSAVSFRIVAVCENNEDITARVEKYSW